MHTQHCDHTLLEAFLEFGDLRGFDMQILKDPSGRSIGSVDCWGNNYFFANTEDQIESINDVLFSDKIRNTEFITVINNRSLKNEEVFWGKKAFKIVEECLMKKCNAESSLNAGLFEGMDAYSYRQASMLSPICSIFLRDPTFRVMAEYLAESKPEDSKYVKACLAFFNEQPVGVLVLSCKANFDRIEWIFTLPEFRNQGVLKALLSKTLFDAEGNGRPLYVKTASQFESYFQKLGFETCDRADYFRCRCVKPVDIQELPTHAGYNGVLKSRQEFRKCVDVLKSYNLPVHCDGPKNWDSFAALDIILRHSGDDRIDKTILDAGGEPDSAILPQLEACGFKNLRCINLSISDAEKVEQIEYSYGDITSTGLEDGFFDFIVCLSVIEHGVDLCSFFTEMNRILKKGGLLITSTDYWRTSVGNSGKIAYNSEVRVFNEDDILRMTSEIHKYGFTLKEPLDFECDQRVIKWFGMNYTFIYFTLEKV